MRFLLAMLGAATIVAALLPLAARLSWLFELFTHFRVQLVAVLATLLVVFAARSEWAWCAAFVACLAINVLPLVPYFRPAARATAAPTFTVAVANVYARNDKFTGLLESIVATDPDVVVVVEYTQRGAERLAPVAQRYPHGLQIPRTDAFGIALFSRYPLEPAREIALESTAAIDARVMTPRGPVRVIGVHLRPPVSAQLADERNAQLLALTRYVQAIAEPIVVLGDFNATPYSPYFADWLAATGLRDARHGFGMGVTWPTFFPLLGVPIDYCLVSADLGVAQYQRLPAFGSDHYPVLARLVQE